MPRRPDGPVARTETVVTRVTTSEKSALKALASRNGRNESEQVRALIVQASAKPRGATHGSST